jgi:hypothetical protein
MDRDDNFLLRFNNKDYEAYEFYPRWIDLLPRDYPDDSL